MWMWKGGLVKIVNATKFPYDLTNITGSNNVLEFVQGVNNFTDGLFMSGMLFAGFVILFIASSKQGVEPKEALAVSGFITTILSIFFFTLEFISAQILTIIIILFSIIFLFIVLKKE